MMLPLSFVFTTLLAVGTAVVLDCDKYSSDFSELIDDPLFGNVHVREPSCSDASDNARGSYTANNKPCQIIFHGIPNADDTSTLRMSTACSTENQVMAENTPSVYVKGWKDECVANFARCYSLDVYENIVGKLLCEQNWILPEDVTHISVDCKADFEASQNDESASDPFGIMADLKQTQQNQLREVEKFVIVLIFALVLACCCCGFAGYRYMWRPYQASRRLIQAERDGLMLDKCENNCDEETESTSTTVEAQVT